MTKAGLTGPLTGKVMVITGGGTGIGAATGIECARAGMDILIVGRRIDPLKRTADAIKSFGARCECLALDVAEEGASSRILDCATETFGGFDAVFANAGYGVEKPLASMTEHEIRRMIEVNLLATAFLMREAGERFIRDKKPGHILACSSCLSKYTMPNFGVYSATKSGQNMLCRSMRFECRPHGVEVSSVHPVTTLTEFFDVAQHHSGSHAGLLKHKISTKSSGFFVQPSSRVGRAVVRCLRRPRSEVWTSYPARLAGGLFELFPPIYDVVLRIIAARARKERSQS